jgi:hypothetical protein
MYNMADWIRTETHGTETVISYQKMLIIVLKVHMLNWDT